MQFLVKVLSIRKLDFWRCLLELVQVSNLVTWNNHFILNSFERFLLQSSNFKTLTTAYKKCHLKLITYLWQLGIKEATFESYPLTSHCQKRKQEFSQQHLPKIQQTKIAVRKIQLSLRSRVSVERQAQSYMTAASKYP